MNEPETPTPELRQNLVPLDPAVAKSIEKDSAFSKPGTMSKPHQGKGRPGKGMRFRALAVKREPGRPRKKPRDYRDVKFW
jgi:hypothetical protein